MSELVLTNEPIFLDVNGATLAVGDCAHVKHGRSWARVWVRQIRASPFGKKRLEVLVDNGERWDTNMEAMTWSFTEWIDDPKQIRRAPRQTLARDRVAELEARVAELEAPGECASIHKLQAKLSEMGAQHDLHKARASALERQLAEVTAEHDRLSRIAESRDLAAIIAEERADAVAADRKAAGKWIRGIVGSPTLNGLARSIEHGDHVDDSEPLESLSLTMLARDAALERVAQLEAELEKPVAGPWEGSDRGGWFRFPHTIGRPAGAALAYVPGVLEGTQDKARHAEDLHLAAKGYRLIGGVHPARAEVTREG